MPSSEAEELLSKWSANPKIQIYHVIRGKKAFDTAQVLFKGILDEDRWTSAEKGNALFFLYLRKRGASAVLGFKLDIGEGQRRSVLGEEKPFEEALQEWSGEH